MWFDTAHDNQLYRADSIGATEIVEGGWELVRDLGIAEAIGDAATAQAAAVAAQGTADGAQTAAENAQGDATTALGELDDIAADDKITPVEKLTLLPLWNGILAEKADIDAEADTFGVSKVAYGTAYNNLYGYVVTTLNTFGSMTTTTDITRATWNGYFEAYYNAKIEILNAISSAAKTLA
ncbi:unnamed protein product, partial [marine sediment metagenome]